MSGNAANIQRIGPHYIAFTQRSLLAPWRVYRIVQEWTGTRWIVVSKTRWFSRYA